MTAEHRKTIRFPFTKTRLEAVPVPDTGRVYVFDANCAGLCLCATATGSKAFYHRSKVNGRSVRLLLGKFPGMTVEQARKAALVVSGEVAKGNDPHAQRIAQRHEQTLQGLWGHWLGFAKDRKRTWREDERQFKVFLRGWGSRRLSSIHRADAQALHAKIGREHGPYAANRLLALVKAMFNKAADIGYSGENPARGIKKFPEVKRDRFLQDDELPRFFQSLHQEPELFRDFFLLALLTGARRANVQAMAWADVNLNMGLWRIPADQAKAGETIVVPLSPQAVEILRDRLAVRDGSPFVFPSHGKSGHLTEPKFAWKRILGRAALSDVRLHDLRRTLGSWMAMGGASLPIVGKLLGHRQASTTQIYARLQVDPIREHVNAATEAMLAAGGVRLLGHDTESKSQAG